MDKANWKDCKKNLKDLQDSAGWDILVKNIEDNLGVLEKIILTKQDDNGIIVTDYEIDVLREKRIVLKMFLETPELIIQNLNNEFQESDKNISMDPFESVGGEIDIGIH